MDDTFGEAGRVVLPAGIENLPPGPQLAAALAGLDLARLSSHDLYVLLGVQARQANHEQARLLAVLLEAARSRPDTLARTTELDQYSAGQAGFELTWSPSYARSQLHLARALIDDLPNVYAALLAGLIDTAKAAAFTDLLHDLDLETARSIAGRVLPKAPDLALGTLRERLRYHAKKANPDAARRQYQRGVTNRQVLASQATDGTVDITGQQLPPHRAAAAINRLDRLARAAKAEGDPRTLSQLAADAFCDLIEGRPFHRAPTIDASTADADAQPDAAEYRESGYPLEHVTIDGDPHPDRGGNAPQEPIGLAVLGISSTAPAPVVDGQSCCTCGGIQPAPRRGAVDLHVAMSTLMCLDDNPGLIPGWGPVIAEIARQVAHDQDTNPAWRYTITDRDGTPIHHGKIRRRPTSSEKTLIQARDRTCQAKGCHRQAIWCDLDHQTPAADGGPAHRGNLCTLCRYHHRLRHEHGYVITRIHSNTIQWEAENRRIYTVLPDGTQLLTHDDVDPPPSAEDLDEAWRLWPPEPDELYTPDQVPFLV